MLCFLMLPHHVFHLWFHAWNLIYVTSPQKQVIDISFVLKDSDTESENLSSLIPLSVSDGQKGWIIYKFIINSHNVLIQRKFYLSQRADNAQKTKLSPSCAETKGKLFLE